MSFNTILETLSGLGFEHVLLWLLTFALIHGLMGQARILDNARETRAIIAIVAGFFVILAAPEELINVISNMSAGMILIVMAILVIVAFVEALGLKHVVYESAGIHPETRQEIKRPVQVGFFTRHTYILAAVLIIVGILIFFGSGGASLLGLENVEIDDETITSVILIIVIIISVLWMIQGEKAR